MSDNLPYAREAPVCTAMRQNSDTSSAFAALLIVKPLALQAKVLGGGWSGMAIKAAWTTARLGNACVPTPCRSLPELSDTRSSVADHAIAHGKDLVAMSVQHTPVDEPEPREVQPTSKTHFPARVVTMPRSVLPEVTARSIAQPPNTTAHPRPAG